MVILIITLDIGDDLIVSQRSVTFTGWSRCENHEFFLTSLIVRELVPIPLPWVNFSTHGTSFIRLLREGLSLSLTVC